MAGTGTKAAARLLYAVTFILGWESMLALLLFLAFGPPGPVALGLSETGTLALDACLSIAFFLQHSVMVRRPFRRWLARYLPPRYDGAVFAIASAVVLLALVVLWQESSTTIAAAHGPARWLLRGAFAASIAGVFWGVRALGALDPLGLDPIRDHLRGASRPAQPFRVRGPYRWVRHPLYSFALLMIWSCPDLTADRLAFNVLFTIWMVVGTLLEERDLVNTFGAPYREYRRRVPMLLPWRLRPVPAAWHPE